MVSRLCAENLSVKSRTRSRFRYQIYGLRPWSLEQAI